MNPYVSLSSPLTRAVPAACHTWMRVASASLCMIAAACAQQTEPIQLPIIHSQTPPALWKITQLFEKRNIRRSGQNDCARPRKFQTKSFKGRALLTCNFTGLICPPRESCKPCIKAGSGQGGAFPVVIAPGWQGLSFRSLPAFPFGVVNGPLGLDNAGSHRNAGIAEAQFARIEV